MNIRILHLIFLFVSLVVVSSGCNKSESYSNLLKDEIKAVNWYLAGQQVSVDVPQDINEFIVGEDAPFYKLNEEGTVYMQILNQGNIAESDRPQKDDKVYFRYSRKNLKMMWLGMETSWEGNSEDLSGQIGPTSFIYGNTYLTSTTAFGQGIQLPLQYVGYNSEVNLIIKASEGPTDSQSTCIPFLYKLRYFKALY